MRMRQANRGKRAERGTLCAPGLILLALVACPPLAWSTTVDIGQRTRIFVPLQSFKALRDAHLIRQGFDYSCGAAALATLLTYGLQDPITEREVLLEVLTALSKDEEALRKKEGLSLLDLQKVALARGHNAQGFRMTPEFLPKLGGPVIVFIRPRGYDHFAVLKGVRGDQAYVADPSRGNLRMGIGEFLRMWIDEKGKGILFVVEPADGPWPSDAPLLLPPGERPQPETLSVRQLLDIASRVTRFPQ